MVTLEEYLNEAGVEPPLFVLIDRIQEAVRSIAAVVRKGEIAGMLGAIVSDGGGGAAGRDKQKFLDVLANDTVKSVLINSGVVAAMASEEDETAMWVSDSGTFSVVFDPLDGSRNIEANLPTGSIFGIYPRAADVSASNSTDDAAADKDKAEAARQHVLQPGSRQVAAIYSLYSSATMLVLSVGHGVQAFTLDDDTKQWVLTHRDMKIPQRGQTYSVNDARYFDWPKGLQQYIDTVRQGKGESKKKYSARYVCSLVADFHRTLLYGGVAMNPRSHLRLLYEANPLSFIVAQAGGRGSDGRRSILYIQPSDLHQRLPLFLGGSDDMAELEGYKDVQQVKNPGYEI